MTQVPIVCAPHPPDWPVYDREAIRAASRLIAEGRTFDYARGDEIARIEDSFAGYHGGGHALFLNSGTSAILSALLALDIGPGDEVLCPATTFVSGITPVLLAGAAPVFVDGDPQTDTMDPEAARASIGPRTRAILVTHLWGHPADMPRLMNLADRHGLAVIEDCSHAHGARLGGRLVGTFGDAAAFSLGTGKMISGGTAGMLLTRDRHLYERACLLGHPRQRSRISVCDPDLAAYANTGLGGNLRGSPVAAVLAQSHLDRLDKLIARKRANLQRLSAGLSGLTGIEPPWTAPEADRGGWYGFHARFNPIALPGATREGLICFMKSAGARVAPATRLPLHREALFRDFRAGCLPDGLLPMRRGVAPPDHVPYCPVSDSIFDRTICFPAGVFHEACPELVDEYIAAAQAAVETFSQRAPGMTQSLRARCSRKHVKTE